AARRFGPNRRLQMQTDIWLQMAQPKPNADNRDRHNRHRRQQNFRARFSRPFAALERYFALLVLPPRPPRAPSPQVVFFFWWFFFFFFLGFFPPRFDQHVVEL